MSTVAISAECVCGSIGRDDLRQCKEHFKLWRGDKRLASVSSVVKKWTQEPCNVCGAVGYDMHKIIAELRPQGCSVWDKIQNATRRGREVDALLTEYVRTGGIAKQSVGSDAKALFEKVRTWLDKQPFDRVEAQVLLGDDEIGGVVDLRCDGGFIDLKATYDLTHAHRLQVAGYVSMGATGNGKLLHVTERYDEPRLVALQARDHQNWSLLRTFWRAVHNEKGD